jgi:hypothetical protein
MDCGAAELQSCDYKIIELWRELQAVGAMGSFNGELQEPARDCRDYRVWGGCGAVEL